MKLFILLEKLTAHNAVLKGVVFFASRLESSLHIKHGRDPVRRFSDIIAKAVDIGLHQIFFGN